MLMNPTPRVGPIVVHLATQQVAPNAPHVLVLVLFGQMRMAHEHIVNVLHFVGEMVNSCNGRLDSKKGVMVDKVVAPIQSVEGSN